MVFQDPMMTLNPVLRIDTQMIEAVQAHAKVGREEARQRLAKVAPSVGDLAKALACRGSTKRPTAAVG